MVSFSNHSRVLASVLLACAVLAINPAIGNNRSSTIAINPDGTLLAAINNDSRSVTLVELPSHEVRAEILVGRDPRNVAFSHDGSKAYVTNRWEDSLSVVDTASSSVLKTIVLEKGEIFLERCDEPAGVMALEDGRVFVNCFGSDTLVEVDPETDEMVNTVPMGDAPKGMAFDASRNLLYVSHFFDGEIHAVNADTLEVEKIISTGGDSNLVNGIIIHPDGDRAWIPHTRSNVGNEALLFDTTVFPVVTVIDLEAQAQVFSDRIHLDIADEPVNMPFDAVITSDELVWVLNAGSNDISVIDLTDNKAVAHIEVGHNPRGLALSTDGSRLYVNNNLAGTVSVIDTARREVIDEIVVTEIALTRSVLNGKRLFHSSDRPDLARDQWISCATCHPDGEMDRRTWFFPDGPRNTPSLLGVRNTLPVHWSGDLDELQDVELTIRDIQAGTGLTEGEDNCDPACDQGPPNAGRSQDLDDLAEYMESLQFPPNPNLLRDGTLTPGARNGQVVFDGFETLCTFCHVDLVPHVPLVTDVGTGSGPDERKGSEFDSPSLRGLYKTAPYLHNGSAATLMDMLTTQNPDNLHGGTSNLSQEELESLILYLNSIGTDETEFPLTGVFAINAGLNDAWFDARQSGQGFFIIVFRDRREIFLAWFTYDTEQPDPSVVALFGAADQRWMTAQGSYSGYRAELKITLTQGGVFDDPDHQVTNREYGTLVLEFTGCNSGFVRYEIPSLGLEGLIAIERLARDNIALCEKLEHERLRQ